MIGIGIVGYGLAGRIMHAALIRRVPELRIDAVVTRDAARRAQAIADAVPRVYQTPDELLADPQIDLVVVATTHASHADLACAALAAGKHVVVDKPMAIHAADADRMIAAATTANRMLTVFQNRRWDWDYLTVREVIRAGLIGRPYLFETAVLTYREPRRTWRADPESMGSLLHDWGAHLIDQAHLLIGAPATRVYARIVHARPEPAIGNYARIDLTFADGTLFAIEMGNLCRPAKPRWYVLGDRGGIVKHGLDPHERALRATGNPDDAVELLEERTHVTTEIAGAPAEIVLEAVRGTWIDFYRNVADHLVRGAPLAVEPAQSRAVLAVLDAALRSVETGEAIPLD